MKFFNILILIFITLNGVAQPYLFKKYNIDVPARNRGWDLQVDEEGYTIATGSLCDGDHSCVGLVRLDLEGNVLWKRVIDVLPNKFRQGRVNCIHRDQVGDIVIAGDQYIGDTDFRIFMMKFSIDGDSLWTKFYESPSSQFTRSLHELDNGDWLIYGDGDNTDTNLANKTIIKTDSEGEVIWHHDYLDTFRISIWGNMEVLQTGELLMGYHAQTWTQFDPWLALTKLTSEGEEIWTRKYYQDLINSSVRVRELNNGNYMMVSSRDTMNWVAGIGPIGVQATVVDTSGNILHKKMLYHGNIEANTFELRVDTEGNVLGMGQLYSDIADDLIPWMFKLTPEGDIIWERLITNEGHFTNEFFILEDFEFTPSGDIACSMTLENDPLDPLSKDFALMILDDEGCFTPGCDTSVQFIVTPTRNLPTETKINIQVFPNPTNDLLQLTWDTPIAGELRLINTLGQIEKSQSIGHTLRDLELNLSTLPNGLYYLQLTENNQFLYQEKIIIIR